MSNSKGLLVFEKSQPRKYKFLQGFNVEDSSINAIIDIKKNTLNARPISNKTVGGD